MFTKKKNQSRVVEINLNRPPTEDGRNSVPTRLRYRAERIVLSPLFRDLLRGSFAVFVVSLTLGGWLLNHDNRTMIADYVTDAFASVRDMPQFMVSEVKVNGASIALERDIRAIVSNHLPKSRLILDTEELRHDIIASNIIRDTTLTIDSQNRLVIDVVQRNPAAVMQTSRGFDILDEEGYRIITETSRRDFLKLPLVIGEGANKAVDEAVSIWQTLEPYRDQVRGLMRIGSRRWDVVLNDGRRIMLPANNPDTILVVLVAIMESEQMLQRDVTEIDLRNPNRVTLRLGKVGLEAIRPKVFEALQKAEELRAEQEAEAAEVTAQ